MVQFYSYLWLREDGTPQYAGKGMGRRAFVRGSHHLHPPAARSRILIFPMASEADAIESEKALIEMFGRKDTGSGWADIAPCLRNFTDGGDGVSGLRHTEETKQKMSVGHKGRPSWNKGIPQTPDHIAKLSAVRKGKNRGPRPAHVMAALHSPESIAKAAASRVGQRRSEDAKQKMRVAALAREAKKREQRCQISI
jgi:hypothetical protein